MPNRRPEEYLERAQEAEKAADAAQTDIAKNCWRAIANEFRELAAERLRQIHAERER
jgi:hypothetical protein